jgi:energy-coupling factor transporter ATP-binding protein EcfA2
MSVSRKGRHAAAESSSLELDDNGHLIVTHQHHLASTIVRRYVAMTSNKHADGTEKEFVRSSLAPTHNSSRLSPFTSAALS